MSLRRWLSDTIARRFVVTILMAFGATVLLNLVFVNFAGALGQPSILEAGLLNGAATAVRIIETQPPEVRAVIAAAAGTADYRLTWYPGDAPVRLT
ncbi:histidine kinase, partial [Pseudoroseomonas wenyumeiae]